MSEIRRQNAGTFLTNLGPISFSGRTLLHGVSWLDICCDEVEVNVIRSRIAHQKNTRISVTKIIPLLLLREEIDYCPPKGKPHT